MSCKPVNLSVLAYANGFTLWYYITDDTKLELASEGYFDQACDMLRDGDTLCIDFMNFGPATTIVKVKSNVNGRVTIGNLIPLNSKE